MRVLITDDDQAMGDCLRRVVQSAGFVAEVATSGFEALERARCQAPDCIFLDLRMPGLSGLETLCQLRQLKITCPVIIMTGYSAFRLMEGRRGVVAKLDRRCDVEGVARILATLRAPGPLMIGHADSTVCRDLGQALERLKMPVLLASSLEQALVEFESGSRRAIMLNLPTEAPTGFVIDQLSPGLIVYLLTLRGQGLTSHRLGCLQKPFPMEEFIATLDQIHDRAAGLTKS